MTLLKSIDNKGATVAWSPVRGNASALLATGTKEGGGGGFEDYGGDLEIYDLQLNTANAEPKVMGAVHTSSRFHCLTWGAPKVHFATHPLGLIAGGMAGGVVNIFDPKKMIAGAGEASILGKVTKHKANVNALQFNPHSSASHLLASGSSDTEVYITDLQRPDAPQTGTPAPSEAGHHLGEITCLAWNTQVQHIIASASQKGNCIIWDLRNKKPWGKIKDPNGSVYSSIAWNPSDGMQFITATDDDMRPIIRLYDLRATMSTPLAELSEHTQGILGLSWCPHDPSLLMSCSKDNRTLLWDLTTYKSVYELPAETIEQSTPHTTNATSFFGAPAGGAMAGSNRRYDVQWSPGNTAILSTCSFDRKVQVYTLTGQGNARGPKWLRCPTNASFGFGGKLVSIKDNKVFINKFNTEGTLAKEAEQLESALNEEDLRPFCDFKSSNSMTSFEKETWTFLKVHFEEESRQVLLNHLGFDSAAIENEASKYTKKPEVPSGTSLASTSEIEGEQKHPAVAEDLLNAPAVSAEDIFATSPAEENDSDELLEEKETLIVSAPIETSNILPQPLDESEVLIKRLLMVGNFQGAVDTCLATNKHALALLIATYGGGDMWEKTQEEFFKLQKRPFMNVVKAIVRGELGTLISESSLENWRETLAVINTYGKVDEVQDLCNQLAKRLESEQSDDDAASLCYLIAMNVEKTVEIWEKKADQEAVGIGAQRALQNLIERVCIFLKSLGDDSSAINRIGESMARRFGQYSLLLVEQGRLDIANNYASLVKTMPAGKILLDRIYYSSNHWDGDGTNVPENPFGEEKQTIFQSKVPAVVASADTNGVPTNAVPSTVTTAAAAPQPNAYGGYNSNASNVSNSYGGYGTPTNASTNPYGGYDATAASGNNTTATWNPAAATPSPTTGYNNNYATTGYNNAPTGMPQQYAGYSGAANTGVYSTPASAHNLGYGSPMPPAIGGKPLASVSGRPVYNTIPTNDGFESSVGNSKLAAKYGNGAYNPGSSSSTPNWGAGNNTYANTSSSPAASMPAQTYGTPSASPNIFNPSKANKPTATNDTKAHEPLPTPEVPQIAPGMLEEFKPVVEGLDGLITHLNSLGLSPSENRQIQSGVAAITVLKDRLEWRKLSPVASEKLMAIHDMLKGGNMRGALSVHKQLADSKEWKLEKDWLKGLKFVLQVGVKKFNL